VHTNCAAASGTFPTTHFVFHEFLYPELLDVFQIPDRAHAISRAISLIHMFDPVAGVGLAVVAKSVFGFFQFVAVSDFAVDAAF